MSLCVTFLSLLKFRPLGRTVFILYESVATIQFKFTENYSCKYITYKSWLKIILSIYLVYFRLKKSVRYIDI